MSQQGPIEETLALTVAGVGAAALILIVIMVGVFVVPVVVVIAAAYIGWRTYYNSESQQELRARARTYALYEEAKGVQSEIPDKQAFGTEVYSAIHGRASEPILDALIVLTLDLYDIEQFDTGIPPPPLLCNSIEGGKYRDALNALVETRRAAAAHSAITALQEAFQDFLRHVPPLPEGSLTFDVPMYLMMKNPGAAVEALILPLFDADVRLFTDIKRQLVHNQHIVSGVPLHERESPKLINPSDYDGHDAPQQYLKNTPFLDVFMAPVPYAIPDKARFAHHHIVAGTNHGKTQTLQYLIAQDLDAVARGEASIVVLDSQQQMIPLISRLKRFAPGGDLHGKLVLIDPTDVQYPVALPLFQRKPQTDPAEDERLHNVSLSLLSYVFEGLLDTNITSYQRTLLGYAFRACMAIPEATIHTLREVIQDVSRHQEHLSKLDPLSREFFATLYANETYRRSRQEVLSKLASVFNNAAFTRMFSSPKPTFDMYDEMNAGKVILIDTAKGHLAEGSAAFGRFFISLVLRAAHQRLNTAKLPTFFYLDEAHEYFDKNVGDMLEQARKSNIGLVLAHQYLGQLDTLRSSVLTNTMIKFAGGVSADDASTLAKEMETTPEFIRAQPPLTFAASVRGQPAVSLKVPAGHLEAMDRMAAEEWDQVREELRQRYGHTPIVPEYVPPPPREPSSPQPPQKPRRKPETTAAERTTTTDGDDVDTGASNW